MLMNKKFLSLALGMAALCESSERNFDKRVEPKVQNYKVNKTPVKQLHKFIIQGVEIMASSKKDAFKRYRHRLF